MRSATLRLLIVAAVALGVALTMSRSLDAQGTKAAPPQAAKGAKAAPLPTGKAAVQEFTALMQKRRQLETRMQELEKEFQATDPAGKQKIQQTLQTEIQPIIIDFQKNTLPRILALAPIVYEQDPQQFDAGEIVMQMAFGNNQYDRAAEVADQLLKAGRQTPEPLNFGAPAEFARHNFARSQQLLDAAKKKEQLDESVGGMFIEPSKKYGDYWKQEQQIRAAESKAAGNQALPQVELNTTKGKVVVELFENQAPNTVANFISLVEKKAYDGTRFHRVIPNFMAQGGSPTSRDEDPSDDREGDPGYTIACECYRPDARRHFRGTLSMAHGGKDTGGSQFFITHLPAYWLNAEPAPIDAASGKQQAEVRAGHTVFGRVISGMESVDSMEPNFPPKLGSDKIISARVLRKRNHPYQPKTLAKQETPKAAPPRTNGQLKNQSKKVQ